MAATTEDEIEVEAPASLLFVNETPNAGSSVAAIVTPFWFATSKDERYDTLCRLISECVVIRIIR